MVVETENVAEGANKSVYQGRRNGEGQEEGRGRLR